MGIYTKDFSKRGCAFVSPLQLYPEEIVRIILPTFWIRLHIVCGRAVGPSCYEFGGELLEQNQPCESAFQGITIPNFSVTA